MGTSETCSIDLDHVYILVTENAPEAAILQSFGLCMYEQEARHTGQGTASRFFLFKNMYLELIWISDMQEMIQHAERTGIDLLGSEQPWQETGESPFGVAFHYLGSTSTLNLPVNARRYQEKWMPEASWIDMIPGMSIYEPEYFIVSDGMAYINLPDPDPLSDHPLGITHLTQLCVTVAGNSIFSPMTRFLTERNILQVQEGSSPLMELTFDSGIRRKSLDCRPTLPLVIHC